MHPSQTSAARQRRRVLCRAENTDACGFFNLLTGPRLLDDVEELLPEHRERLFPPTETLSMFMAQRTGTMLAADAADWWRWRGRRVYLADGTTVTMADTQENQAEYPQPGSQRDGLGCPMLRVVALMCLASGALLAAATGACKGKGSDEQTLLRGLLDHLGRGDVLLGDAFLPTYFLLCELGRRGIDGLFEQYGARQRSTAFPAASRLAHATI